MEILRLKGSEARAYSSDLAQLRVRVFWEYPYLYEGNPEYEARYLETYFKAQHAFILILKDGSRVIGATTAIHADEEEESFKRPFIEQGLDPKKVFYFGESVLLPEYRGQGLGKVFMNEREAFARSLGFIDHLAFSSVVRPDNHPLRPGSYQPLDTFWESQGFHKVPGMITNYEWLDRDTIEPSQKPMQFWMKNLRK